MILEPIKESHADSLIYFLNYDKQLQQFMYPGNQKTELITKEIFLKTNQEWIKNRNAYMFAIIVDSTVIGMTTLTILPESNAVASSGVWIASQYWNMGYSTQRLLLLIDYAKAYQIKELTSKIRKDNPASKRVWEKCNASFTEDEQYYYAVVSLQFGFKMLPAT